MSDSDYYAARSSKLTEKKNQSFESDDEYFARKKSSQAKPATKRVHESDNESAIVRNKKKVPSKQTAADRTNKSDDESAPRRKTKESKAPAKRKPAQSRAKKTEDWKVFDSESEDEALAKQPQQLRSSYSKRVADGVVRRTAQLEGGLFLDLKLYQVDDIKNVHPLKRHEKAVLALRLQADHDSPELAALQQLLRRCKARFTEDSYFYPDKLD